MECRISAKVMQKYYLNLSPYLTCAVFLTFSFLHPRFWFPKLLLLSEARTLGPGVYYVLFKIKFMRPKITGEAESGVERAAATFLAELKKLFRVWYYLQF